MSGLGWVLMRGGLGAEELIAENAVGPCLELFDRPAAFADEDGERLGSMQPVYDVGGPVSGEAFSQLSTCSELVDDPPYPLASLFDDPATSRLGLLRTPPSRNATRHADSLAQAREMGHLIRYRSGPLECQTGSADQRIASTTAHGSNPPLSAYTARLGLGGQTLSLVMVRVLLLSWVVRSARPQVCEV